MKTLIVKLKQHTPLIHFQHDQYGATLRASEVKPKLDRFIIENVFENDWDNCKEFLVGYKKSRKESDKERKIEEEKLNQVLKQKFNDGFRALNYKMKIEACNLDEYFKLEERDTKTKYDKRTGRNIEVFSLEDFPMLLSNMGGKENKSDLMNFSYSSGINLIISFFDIKKEENLKDTGLYDIVEKEIRYFFANNNFGQRSTKGFGSFTVVKINDTPIEWDNSDVYENDTKVMRYDVDKIDDFDTIKGVFDVVDFYWKSLKTGVNCTKRIINRNGNIVRIKPERYIKSFLWTYLNKKNKTWEKRQIKNALSLECNRPNGEKVEENNNPVFFARAHMGCPISGFTYKVPQSRLKDRKREDVRTIDVKISSDRKKDIERIASPIFFKPVFHQIVDNKTQKVKNVVSIYILYDKCQIQSLYNAPDTNYCFSGNDKTTSIPLFVNDNGKRFEIDFHELITEFHKSLDFKLTPRNYKWENVLGENVDVKLLETVKK